ncbi:MAG: response regulator [Dehalococcoidia bacterium]
MSGEEPQVSPRRVLVIDDDPAIVRLLGLTLEAADFDVRKATDGRSAVEAIDDGLPDLVLLDLQLPDMDGREVFRRLRASGYGGPVVIISAHGARSARRELGADAAVDKPFDPDFVLDRVEALLSARNGHGD